MTEEDCVRADFNAQFEDFRRFGRDHSMSMSDVITMAIVQETDEEFPCSSLDDQLQDHIMCTKTKSASHFRVALLSPPFLPLSALPTLKSLKRLFGLFSAVAGIVDQVQPTVEEGDEERDEENAANFDLPFQDSPSILVAPTATKSSCLKVPVPPSVFAPSQQAANAASPIAIPAGRSHCNGRERPHARTPSSSATAAVLSHARSHSRLLSGAADHLSKHLVETAEEQQYFERRMTATGPTSDVSDEASGKPSTLFSTSPAPADSGKLSSVFGRPSSAFASDATGPSALFESPPASRHSPRSPYSYDAQLEEEIAKHNEKLLTPNARRLSAMHVSLFVILPLDNVALFAVCSM